MKQLFLLGIMGFAVIWVVGYFLYRIVLAFVDLYDDWQLAKEVREIEADAARRRAEKARPRTGPPATPSNVDQEQRQE